VADQVALRSRPGWALSNQFLVPLFLLLIAGIAVRFLAHYALPYFRFNPNYFQEYWPHRARLVFHICGGILALCCGPFQFWTGLRQKAMGLHRWTGRLYLVGVGVGTTGAFLMAVFTQPRNLGVALMVMATVWILCTATAYGAIIRGLVPMHKEWMMRSYIVTFGFVTFRFIDELPIAARLLGSYADRSANIAWLCWFVPLFAFEMILQARRIWSADRPA